MSQAAFPFEAGAWWAVSSADPRAAALADRHYSRQTPGAPQFMGTGRKLVLLTADARAVWGAIEHLDPVGGLHWRCNIFRNEMSSAGRSSELVREATARTFAFWLARWGLPVVPLRTEVDVRRVRHKRDPGRCFLRAGWRVVPHARGEARGFVVLEAPADGVSNHSPDRAV